MKVKIDVAKKKLKEIYEQFNLDSETVEWLVELALDMDLEGNYFSGIGETPESLPDDMNPSLHETFEIDKPSLKFINGNGKDARLVIKDLVPEAVVWAREQGQIFIGFKNCGYHENLGTIARKFAEQNLLCIYSSNGGPQGVVPYGGTKDIFGTNPVAYGIPTSDVPIVFDAATAQRAYGTIKHARESQQPLPPESYFDKVGQYTTDPNEAVSLIPFGGYKGYAFNLLFDVLDGALVGSKSGRLVKTDSDLGAILLIIDPAAFGPIVEFKAQTDKLVQDIVSNPPAPGFSEVRVPGYRAHEHRAQQIKAGELEIDEAVWQKFMELHDKVVS